MKLTRRLIVVSGSRDYPDQGQVEALLAFEINPGDVVMHGAARGVDSWADSVARELGACVEPMPANWEKEGRSAGIRRNHRMLDRAATARELGWDVQIIDFWANDSPGTHDAIDYARRLGFVPEVWTPGGRL